MSTRAENHALQVYRLLGQYDRAGGKGCGLGDFSGDLRPFEPWPADPQQACVESSPDLSRA